MKDDGTFEIGDPVIYYPIQDVKDYSGRLNSPPQTIEGEVSGIAAPNLRIKTFEKKFFGMKKKDTWINGNYFHVRFVQQ